MADAIMQLRIAREMFRSLQGYRNVAAIVVALGLLQGGASALSAFAPLTLLARGEGVMAISIVTAFYAAGFLLGALRATGAVRAIGHIRAFAGFAGGATLLVLALYGLADLWFWLLLQAGIGFCMASLLTTGESWIADVAPREQRGSILSYYLVVSKIGQISGPALLVGLAPAHPVVFMGIAAAFAGSLIPVCATRRTQPLPPSVQPFGVRDTWVTAPAAVLAAFAAGAVNGAVLQLYPLYAVGDVLTSDFSRTAVFNAALAAGALIAQWPAGRISDAGDRRLVIGALAALGSMVAFALGIFRETAAWPVLLILAGLWGAGAMSFYGIAVAHAADRAAPGQTTAMMSGILVVWALGALIGPLLAGLAIASPLGAGGLFIYASVVLATLAFAMMARRVGRQGVPAVEKSPFTVAPTTSTALASLDPRADETFDAPCAQDVETNS